MVLCKKLGAFPILSAIQRYLQAITGTGKTNTIRTECDRLKIFDYSCFLYLPLAVSTDAE
jgi:hypothetical protein